MPFKPMPKSNKVQVTVQLDPDQAAAVDRIATKRRTSRAAVTREAVDLYLSENSDATTMESGTMSAGRAA